LLPLVTASLHESPTPSQHSVEGSSSLEVDIGRLSSVDSLITIPGVTGGSYLALLFSPLLLFFQDPALKASSQLPYR